MDLMKSSDIAKHSAVLRVSNKPTTPPNVGLNYQSLLRTMIEEDI